MAAWVPMPGQIPYSPGYTPCSPSKVKAPPGLIYPDSPQQRQACDACFRSQHALAEAKVAEASALQQAAEEGKSARAASEAAQAAELRAAKAEALSETLAGELEAAKREISELNVLLQLHREETATAERCRGGVHDGSVRRFLQVKTSFESEAGGYLSAAQGDELVAVHCKDDWYYGFHLLEPGRSGWFAQRHVED